jgi:hypothetical protein
MLRQRFKKTAVLICVSHSNENWLYEFNRTFAINSVAARAHFTGVSGIKQEENHATITIPTARAVLRLDLGWAVPARDLIFCRFHAVT